MSETIKTYQEITVEEAGEMLRENGWKPVKGMALRDDGDRNWKHCDLTGIVTCEDESPEFHTQTNYHFECAKVTEIDPCKAPDGCPELEDWMAYVGTGMNLNPTGSHGRYWMPSGGKWISGYANVTGVHYAVDARTEWAQEHFPEFCRIRNYQEPEDEEFEMWFDDRTCDGGYMTGEFIDLIKVLTKEAFELGKANPKK